MLIRYLRVSTGEQSLDLQRDALDKIGCERIYEDVCSGRVTDHLRLSRARPPARAVSAFT
jgi:DNA invertase Pin-like site-specific DNA recombinase